MQDGQTKTYAQITQKKKEEREAKQAAERAAAMAAAANATSNATSTTSVSNAEPADSDNTKKIVKEQTAVKTNQFHGKLIVLLLFSAGTQVDIKIIAIHFRRRSKPSVHG